MRFTARVFTSLCIAILPGCAGCFLGGSATSMGSRWDIFAGGGSYLGTHPSVSPDGLSVVYSTPATGQGDIYRFDRTTGRNVRLTTDPEYDGYPLFSRDGKHLLFEHEKNGVAHLYIMDADGESLRPLTDGPTFDFGASFSKDGRTIVFCRDREGVCHLWKMDADGRNPRPLTDGPWFDSSPSFSPDGGRIVFKRQEKGQIYLTPPSDEESLSRRFPEILVMNADGSDQRRLTHNRSWDEPLSFSPDGKRIFCYREDEYDKVPKFWGTTILDVDGSNSRDIGEGFTPALSPDGRQIVFGTYEPGIGLMNADGTGRRTIYRSRFNIGELTFTPDGAHIVFVEWPEEHGAGSIKILDLETTKTEMAPDIK